MMTMEKWNAKSRIEQDIAHAKLLRSNAKTQDDCWHWESVIRNEESKLSELLTDGK